MEEIENMDGKDRFILSSNSGEVYYKKSDVPGYDQGNAHARAESVLGDFECKKCFVKKPFEKVRWNPDHNFFVCLDCLANLSVK